VFGNYRVRNVYQILTSNCCGKCELQLLSSEHRVQAPNAFSKSNSPNYFLPKSLIQQSSCCSVSFCDNAAMLCQVGGKEIDFVSDLQTHCKLHASEMGMSSDYPHNSTPKSHCSFQPPNSFVLASEISKC
jgi:hypothetical protein